MLDMQQSLSVENSRRIVERRLRYEATDSPNSSGQNGLSGRTLRKGSAQQNRAAGPPSGAFVSTSEILPTLQALYSAHRRVNDLKAQ
jgi:hypothetical protein